ncbi:MAG: hypothetical protein K0U74_12425 [Alphaproteobacteria bacterium]|nr:hypothetical protein [Alphaproteobacteria bacterium]
MVHETVPKVELHCHLIGVLNSALLGDLAKAGEKVLVEPCGVTPVGWGEGADGFANWLVRVDPYKSASWRQFLPILGWHIERLVAQNVVYAEMMISPLMFSRDLAQATDEFSEFQEWVWDRENGRIQIEFLFLVPRSLPDELIDKDIARCVALGKSQGISGISIAGLERDCPVSRFRRMFEVLKDHGLGIEIHAGELGDSEEVREAIDVGLADRIGHGIAAFTDDGLVDRLIADNVHIEFCPTSNLKMGAAKSIASHPIGRARDLGMNFSINSDDPGAFDCDMASEFQLVERAHDFSRPDFEAVARNSLLSRFQPKLRYQSDARIQHLLSENVAVGAGRGLIGV